MRPVVISKEGGRFVLRSRGSGRVLGRHSTRAAANRQDTAINIFKARAKGHRIPKKIKRR